MSRRIYLALFSLVFCVAFNVNTVYGNTGSNDSADRIDEVGDRDVNLEEFSDSEYEFIHDVNYLNKVLKEKRRDIEDVREKLRAVEDRLDLLKAGNSELVDEIKRVEGLIKLTLDRIATIEGEIEQGRSDLDALYREIRNLEADLASREADFRERVMVSSKVSFMNYLEVVVRADSFTDMVTKLAGIQKVISHDNHEIEEYLELSEVLADKREDAEVVVRELEERHDSLEDAQKVLRERNERNLEKSSRGFEEYEVLLNELSDLKVAYGDMVSDRERLKGYLELAKEYKVYSKEIVGDYGLHPLLEAKRVELIRLAELKGIRLVTTSGLRTFAEQDALYAKGRTSSGNVVTNAPAGYSWHNFGLAFDVVFDNGSGKPTWDEYDMNENGLDDWDEIGEIGTSIGLEWGGYWKEFLDRPHFQYTFGKDLKDMRKIHGL